MSDDSFIREVDEELRHDRLKTAWGRYGKLAIAAAVLIVLATAGFRGWEYYSATRAAGSGDTFLQALDLSEEGRADAAIAKLEELTAAGSGQYPALARLRIGAELAGKGDKQGAIEQFDAIVEDNGFDEDLRALARLRAGLLAVDALDYDAVKTRLEPLAAAGGDYRSLAREALGLSAWKAGLMQDAANWFQQIVDDAGSAGGVRERASVMLNLLAGKGVTAAG